MLKNIFWLLSEKLIQLFGAVIVTALVARHLQPSGFGVFNFYLAILSVLFVVSSLGLNRIVVRDIVCSKTKNERADVIKTAFYLRFFASLLVFLITVVFTNIFVSDYEIYYSYIVFFCVVINATEILDFYQQGVSDFKKVSVVRSVAFVFSASLKIFLVYINMDLVWFFVANLLEYVVIALLIYRFCARDGEVSLLKVGRFNLSQSKVFLIESWPEIIAGFSAILFLKMDQVMLFYLSSESEVGIYSAAARLSEAWYFLPAAIVATTFPRIIALKKQSDQYEVFIRQIFTLLTYMSIVVALTVTLLSDFIVPLIFGTDYSGSSQVLVIHIWGGVFLCMGIASGSWLVSEKKLKLNLYRNLLGLFVNFLGNLYLIPEYGAIGAAYSMVAGLFFAFYFFDFLSIKLRFMLVSKTKSFSIFQFYYLIKSIKLYISNRFFS